MATALTAAEALEEIEARLKIASETLDRIHADAPGNWTSALEVAYRAANRLASAAGVLRGLLDEEVRDA